MKYKMTVYPAIEAGNPNIVFMFESRVEILAAMHTVADMLLFVQDTAQVMDDYSNMIIMEEKRDGEWLEFELGDSEEP